MACGKLLASRIDTVQRCAELARNKGHHFFAYNQWWKFCLACAASEVSRCDESAIDIFGCHYQVGFAIYQQSFGGPSADDSSLGVAGLATEEARRRSTLFRGVGRSTLALLSLAAAPAGFFFSWRRRERRARHVLL
mmetsp:Transcript_13838/g.32350  ORF Transcript_13838/g.32350 Transcript_13838/m.32350 type:complete len:136 (+) Transcript_13838:1070-1477(+)